MSQAEVQQYLDAAKATLGNKYNASELIQDLVNKKVQIEGLNEPSPKKTGLLDKLAQRVTNVQDSFQRNPNEPLMKQHAILGQTAGGIGDILGSGIGLLGKIGSGLTPDFIENPIKQALGGAANAVAQTPLVQGVTNAYADLKQNSPDTTATLENAANILSLIPISKAGQAGQQVLAKGIKKTGVESAQQGLSKGLKESAEASVAKVLSPATTAAKEATQKLVPQILDRPLTDTLALTRKGMQAKAGSAAEVAGEAIQEAGTLVGKSKTKELVNYLQSQKEQFVAGGKIVNKEGVQSIDEVTDLIAQYGKEVDDETLRGIRKIFDDEYYQGKKNIAKSTGETSQLNFKHQAANKIRGILGEKYPDVAALNKEYNFWSSLQGVLEKTNTRTTGQKGIRKAIAAAAGAASGEGVQGRALGAFVFRTVASLVDSPAWGLMSGKAKNQLADALANADLSKVGKVLSVLPQQALSPSDE
jgi:polyhydroxyalkanoate synthesis regulator phasin